MTFATVWVRSAFIAAIASLSTWLALLFSAFIAAIASLSTWLALLFSAFIAAIAFLSTWLALLFSAVSAASACERTALRNAKQQGAIATQSNGVERSRSGD